MYQQDEIELYERNRDQGTEPIGTYTAKTFLWMFAGLMVTFLVAFFGYSTGAIFYIFAIPYVSVILLIAELAVVIYLSARIERLSVGTARGLFIGYAVLNGIVFSAYLLMFQVSSVILAFALAALYFGIMACIGFVTKADLSGMRPILLSGLIFLIGFWLLSIFLPLAQFERVICLIGIGIFLGFTAYDTQKIRYYHAAFSGNQEMASKASIFAALGLYLDFINLFLYLLRFMGKRN